MIFDSEQRQAMLAAIIDSSEDAIISKNLNSIITSWNISAEKMFGYSESEVVGKHIFIIIPEDLHSEETMIISNLQQGKKIEHFQTTRITKTGKRIPISLTISPIRDSKGVVIGASKIARDISRQVRDEALIRRYAQRLETINKVSTTFITQLDVSAILQTVTDVSTELSGANFGAFFYTYPDVKGHASMLCSFAGTTQKEFETLNLPLNADTFRFVFTSNGIVRSDDISQDPFFGKSLPQFKIPASQSPPKSYLAVPVFSSIKVIIGGLLLLHSDAGVFDKEHERLIEAIASQAAIALDNATLYEKVRVLNTRKDEFIGFASHELKTPLTTMKGYVQLLKYTPEGLKDFLPKIDKQINRLESLISDLLDISKIQAGKLEMNFSPVSLLTLIRESIDGVSQEHHQIIADVPLDDVIVRVDTDKLLQVLVNILSNAIKYSPKGTRIQVSAVQLEDKVRLSVQDQGMGISPDHLRHIFDRFYRVQKSNGIPGMGLGLYISKEIIENHGGEIWAESEEGKGSIFHIMLPIEKADTPST